MLLLITFVLSALNTQAQTVIDIRGSVYGGARQADVGGSTHVTIGADHHDVLIGSVYGGNDISGVIGTSSDEDYDAFVQISQEPTTTTVEDQTSVTTQTHHIFIGNVFGGGNGDYDYTSENYQGMNAPVLGKSSLKLEGGTVAYVYGGGNNATVTVKTDITINNESQVTTAIPTGSTGTENLLSDNTRLESMGIAALGSNALRDTYHYSRVFGGNNKAEMNIMPTWHLNKGKIDNLYSGGNAGKMTCPVGLLLEIDPQIDPQGSAADKQKLVINNVYGGCRKADVDPGTTVTNVAFNAYLDNITPGHKVYSFPDKFSARLLVRGGDINNVYGGNDITGDVKGGNAVGVYTSIRGCIYGGGNGSYPYTDNSDLKGSLAYGDYYYGDFMTEKGYSSSVKALNAFRPNAEQVSIRVVGEATGEKGTDSYKITPTVIGGAIYVGGNSATLKSNDADAVVHLKIGSHVIADSVFLGNNGANMVKYDEKDDAAGIPEGVLRTFRRTDLTSNGSFNSMDLTDSDTFAEYMEGCATKTLPQVVFDGDDPKDPAVYESYTTYVGSLYCGGNVGSVISQGKEKIDFGHEIIVYSKVVGGCNNADVAASDYNAAYYGGILGTASEQPDPDGTMKYVDSNGKIRDRLELNFKGLKIQPRRMPVKGTDYTGDTYDLTNSIFDQKDIPLVWNTIKKGMTDENGDPVPVAWNNNTWMSADDTHNAQVNSTINRRFDGGNIYGGCYTSGLVNGNVVINIEKSIVDRDRVFDDVETDAETGEVLYNHSTYTINQARSGVILDEQGMDVLGTALNVFGGGKGRDTEIWGSTTINLKSGYVFQIFGGSEEGVIGIPNSSGTYMASNGQKYNYDSRFSTTINLCHSSIAGVPRGAASDKNMAEAEFIYGGGFEGLVVGDTHINLGNGRIFNSFAGSCNADILGHTETYIGRNGVDADGKDVVGFPWIRDHVYGGNDLGGSILGSKDFKDRLNEGVLAKVHGNDGETADVLTASAYMEYTRGRVDAIFGGCYGDYDYNDDVYASRINGKYPYLESAFVNIRPENIAKSVFSTVYGAGQGVTGFRQGDKMQDRSYVLINIPDNMENFKDAEVFGAGAYDGLGMKYTYAATTADDFNLDKASAIIDLLSGQISAAYGASYQEGITRRTVVNVPQNSTIKVSSIFGGAYGNDNSKACDAYEAHVEYHSDKAIVLERQKTRKVLNDQGVEVDELIPENQVTGAIYGGNNSARRTLYGKINISVPVYSNIDKNRTATVYGAGFGENTWSQYTEINLQNGGSVWEVYGGGKNGRVLNQASVNAWQIKVDPENLDLTLPDDYTDNGLANALVKTVDNPYVPEINGKKYNTNVHINKGATVGGYAYGGGLGDESIATSGDVCGSTFIGLYGGQVKKDIYAAGTVGGVLDEYKVGTETFTASTTAYIGGGTVRNVFGGGWKGDVGRHDGNLDDSAEADILGETNVVIGIRPDQVNLPTDYGFENGVPAIQRNAYSGGEGGAVFGQAHLTINNGYIGYVHLLANQVQNNKGEIVETTTSTTERYEDKINDETYYEGDEWKGEGTLADCGNVFGGGYDVRSSVDNTYVTMWNGVIRNSLHGGGEIATIGRGATKENENQNDLAKRTLKGIYKPGTTHVKIYNGHVNRNVFGGGKGYNVQGYGVQGTLYTDGYVFGSTEVYIYGGEVGTPETLAEGYGNVFGGGDIGYVYSKGFFDEASRQTGTGSPNHTYYYYNGSLTEDCKVVISPYLQVKPGMTVNDGVKVYGPYEYVPTDYLNTLKRTKDNDGNWTGEWTKFITEENGDDRGVHIRNAVFGGGNVASNSGAFANATTVFGNTTATLYDVYHRDFITVGTEHIGGLYGGGNLSVVDGYRELNITNYGTDYYGLNQQITLGEYEKLSNRERAYFKLEYECQQEHTNTGNNKHYKKGDRISEEEFNKLTTENSTAYWLKFGFCSIYAGRLLNTIQRADLCGVYGSRMVLQGAKDRVIKPDAEDEGKQNVDYTINRVLELSLNKQNSTAGDTDDEKEHGNYFGIYSVVNFLGNLTSDVTFDSNRKIIAKNETTGKEETQTTNKSYYNWKKENTSNKDRNLGTCHNQVALASGVFLELTTEMSNNKNKVYGYITGIVELDLINVKKDIVGGGYVYAKNEHGTRRNATPNNIILSDYNKPVESVHAAARTYRYYTYSEATAELEDIETSGNFIHRKKHIVDDCYPNNGVYNDGYVKSPAHYWYIKGEVYVYDQTVSAYAGSASAYSKEVKIPLTITAGSNGKLKLLNVQPNLYAYYSDFTSKTKIGEDGVKVDNETTTFYLNDVITWWDWSLLDDSEKDLFVSETYTNVSPCKINGKEYDTGTFAMLPTEYPTFDMSTVTNLNGEAFENREDIFRSSNNISHDTGYVLTFDMDTPKDWNDWYSLKNGTSTYTVNPDGTVTTNRKRFDEAFDQANYRVGPTFRLKGGTDSGSGLYGQKQYAVDQIIQEEIVTDYTSTVSQMSPKPSGQAEVDNAYVAKNNVTIGSKTILAGNAISKAVFDANPSLQSNFDQAYVCINTIQFGEEDFLFNGELVGQGDLDNLAAKYKRYNDSRENMAEISLNDARAYVESCLSSAYICTKEGSYGGQYFVEGENYSALKSWCSLTDDRDKFEFNYDAFDVLADPNYLETLTTAQAYKAPYSDEKPVEYNAANTTNSSITYYLEGETTARTLAPGGTIDRTEYERIQNDQRHYTRITIPANGQVKVHVAHDNFYDHGTPIAKGQVLTVEEFEKLDDANEQYMSSELSFVNNTNSSINEYYCYEAYGNVTRGTEISQSTYNGLPNYQKNFAIQGVEPTETTTLYVSRESVFKDVTKEKVISVVYQYTYYEDDDEGDGVSLTNELHVVNIHLQLESGAPQIGKLNTPPTILPGNTLGMKAPTVNPGLYEVITNGWELFPSEADFEARRNGVPFVNNETKLYWYQNQDYQIAFYSWTYLGKTYSDPVPVSVANYHDLSEVMADTDHHLYIDHKGVKREPKIYLDQTKHADENQLDLLKSLHDLSAGSLAGHLDLDKTQVGNCKNLQFILRSNLNHSAEWTPIGTATHCFEGDLHGDGYTISGLDKSLFEHLCGEVYNLGVTGTFNTSGIAESGTGYLENCWVKKTDGAVTSGAKALFNTTTDTDKRTIHLVNCYYPTENSYGSQTGATAKPLQAFYNGEVAYDLNGFYLFKRYCDSQTLTSNSYHYLVDGIVDGKSGLVDTEGHYESKDGPFLLRNDNAICYVESRFADGDFVYADGTIPTESDLRMRVVNVIDANNNQTSEPRYYPIWPDDYIFFGQALNYGHVPSVSHQEQPSHINKSDDTRLLTDKEGNRVYRAAGYFRSSTDKRPVHFNPYAVFAATKFETPDVKVHEGMTALDLMNSGTFEYRDGTDANVGTFYPPLLDDDGLTGMLNADLTQNLLVYTATTEAGTSAADKTNTVVSNYLKEPVYVETNENYHTVDQVLPSNLDDIHGHWIQNGVAVRDHLLVDDNDFNAPLQYSFDSTHRMWYQRTPDNYVSNEAGKTVTVGWEDICLPFIAELVTTPNKGEITHFYGDSKIGHEYWLREFRGVNDENTDGELPAIFRYPDANSDATTGGGNKEYKNTFLWDYYYNNRDHQDTNLDQYQTYYNNTRNYLDYPRSRAGVPYLIGFPGSNYYEFDLSGEFVANFTKEYIDNPIPQLPKQAIIFASKPGITIKVSDTELSQGAVTQGTTQKFTYRPNYLNTTVDEGNYLLTDDGAKYALTGANAMARPFRPYFVPGPASTRADHQVQSIIFTDDDSQLEMNTAIQNFGMEGDIIAKGGKKKITVLSRMPYTVDVRIVTPAGITMASFTLEPSEEVETRVENGGVYIVDGEDGRHVKKVIVR